MIQKCQKNKISKKDEIEKGRQNKNIKKWTDKKKVQQEELSKKIQVIRSKKINRNDKDLIRRLKCKSRFNKRWLNIIKR